MTFLARSPAASSLFTVSRRALLCAALLGVAAGCNKKLEASPSPGAGSAAAAAAPAPVTLLNVSYDPTRELYTDFNAHFAKKWQAEHHQTVTINQSHGGGGKQARAVIDGLEADVVTLAVAYDVNQLHDKAKLIPENWQSRLSSRRFTRTYRCSTRERAARRPRSSSAASGTCSSPGRTKLC
jgi:ABC-type sulfate transport system substrate-binding protein